MKSYDDFSWDWRVYLVKLILIFLLVTLLLPANIPIVRAESDNSTSSNQLLSENITLESGSDNISDNSTSQSDNVTQEEPSADDNTTIEEPPASDNNTTEEPAVSDNTTAEEPAISDNTTAEEPAVSDNTTTEEPAVSDNSTTEEPAVSDNTTTEEPPTSDNTTEEKPSVSDNTTEEKPTSNNTTPEIETTDNITLNLSSKVIEPDKEDYIVSPSGNIKLNLPAGAVTEATKIEIKERQKPLSTGMRMVNQFELDAFSMNSSGEEGVDDNQSLIPDDNLSAETPTQNESSLSGSDLEGDNVAPKIIEPQKKSLKFQKELTLTIQHTSDELRGLDLDSLHLYYLNEENGQWVPVPSTFDSETLILTAKINHFTNFGEQANPLQSGPGRVMAADVNLHSGSSTYSYPLELPPGPGGFQPSLTLTYNSCSVNEMKNKRAVGSWVGIGWNLNLGSITYDDFTQLYYLNLGGISYVLYTTDGTNFKTDPEEYFQISRNGNIWTVYDQNGTYYRFGGTSDSQQYHDSSFYYRWDLNDWKDTNGNEATVSYTQDTWNNSVRSAYPLYLRYDNNLVEVHFISNYDTNDSDGPIRNDNPISYGNNPAPKIMENRHLDAIEIKVSGNLIRKYTFAYNTTNCVYSSSYGGIYYSGVFKLVSLTQVGADGGLDIPTTSFTYGDKAVFRKTSSDQYTGNPGNPASLTWPFLTAVNSGYGGSISFSYTEIPNETTFDLWTRQAVTTKTINSGIGTTEVHTYTYTGNPAYFGTDWDQDFRGWNQVKETDAASNYIKHWFYTTGTINGNNAEEMTGKEYQTQYYDGSNNLLDTKTYNWNWTQTGQYSAPPYVQVTPSMVTSWSASGTSFLGVVASPDGSYVYTTTSSSVYKYTSSGTFVTSWSASYANFFGVAVSSDSSYIYVTNGSSIYKYTSSGTFVTSWSASGANFMGVAASLDGYVYATTGQSVYKYTSSGAFVTSWSLSGTNFFGVAVSPDNYVYVTNWGNNVYKYTASGSLVTYWSASGASFFGLAASSDGYYVYVTNGSSVYKYTTWGALITYWSASYANFMGVAVSPDRCYVYAINNNSVYKYQVATLTVYIASKVYLSTVVDTIGNKTSQTRYVYDSYGNAITAYYDGDISTSADDSTVFRVFYPNTSTNILSKPARERAYSSNMSSDDGGSNLKKETLYYYDSSSSWQTPPTKGNLTRTDQKINVSTTVSTYNTYDTYGNLHTIQDARNNITTWTYDSTYHVYPATKALPISGLSESYTYVAGTNNLLTFTDVNGQTTSYVYDTYQRLTKIIKPEDSPNSPSVQYQYNNWGTINQQNIKIITKVDPSNWLWQAQYFDGLGRVVQIQSNGESGHTIISSTTTFNNRGLVDKKYVSQDIASTLTSYYTSGIENWKYTSYSYDALGRVTVQTNPDGTTINHDYSTAWRDTVTDANNHQKRYYYDAFNRLNKVEEMSNSITVYATTQYFYDVLGNLTQVKDNNNNTTNMTYDWLSRKTTMDDPDMGHWTYGYDNNGNLTSQTDAKSQTINMTYDNLNRLTGKSYPQVSGMTDVSYTYDQGANGKGQRTNMTDASGTSSYKYDNRGRLIEENQVVGAVGEWLPDWNNRIKITIDHTKVTSSLTHFPVLIHLSSSSGQGSDNTTQVFDEVSDNYSKIAVTEGDGLSQLYVEVEKWDVATKQAWLWVSKSDWTISSSNDTTLYLYYNKDHTSNTDYVGLTGSTAAKNVWDNNFKAVWHLNESSGSVLDATVNNVNGTNDGATRNQTGKIGEAYSFDGVNDFLKFGDALDSVFSGANKQFTISAFFKRNNLDNNRVIVGKCADSTWSENQRQFFFRILNSKLEFLWYGGLDASSYRGTIGSTQITSTEQYYQGTAVYDGTQAVNNRVSLYLNGDAESTSIDYSSGNPASIPDGSAPLCVGAFANTAGTSSTLNLNGIIDEIQISNSVRSPSWIKATYYTCWDNFLSFSEPETGGAQTYTTKFGYDSADRLAWVLYPTGENVTQTYDSRGLPDSLSAGAISLVTDTLYNALGMPTQINLGNGLKTTYSYWGIDYTAYGVQSYGRLYEIKTWPQAGGTALQDVRHTWDAGGNLSNRFDVLSNFNENFGYDFLDRLTSVSGNYTESYTYNEIGNIMSRNGTSYGYTNPNHKHAITSVGGVSYGYDANGNMETRGSQSIIWDVENRPVAVSGSATANFTYDGDGNRVKKIESGQTILYINKYFEVNLSTSTNTSYYYHGNTLIAMSVNATLEYVHEDHLTGTSLMSNTSGNSLGTIRYYPFGETISGSVPTDKLFTGQRLDGTGLYYFNARYYDPLIGRFISPDTIVPHPAEPQSLNRYNYCINNPLTKIDPDGHDAYMALINYYETYGPNAPPPVNIANYIASGAGNWMNIPPPPIKVPLWIERNNNPWADFNNGIPAKTTWIGDDLYEENMSWFGDRVYTINGQDVLIIENWDYQSMMMSGWTKNEIFEVLKANPGIYNQKDSYIVNGFGRVGALPGPGDIRHFEKIYYSNGTVSTIVYSQNWERLGSCLEVQTTNGGIGTYSDRWTGPKVKLWTFNSWTNPVNPILPR